MPNNLRAFSDLVIQRFSWSQPAPFTEEDARGYFAGQEQVWLRGEEVQFALVEPRDEDEVLGGGSLYELDLELRCSAVGYWLAPQARGRGAASTAVRLLARWGFTELGLARIELTCGPDNGGLSAGGEPLRGGVMRSHMPFKGADETPCSSASYPANSVSSFGPISS